MLISCLALYKFINPVAAVEVAQKNMELIILNDGLYQLIPLTKQMMEGIVITAEIDCFNLCDIIRLKLTTYHDYPINAHVMNDGSGDFYGCIQN